MLYYYQQHNMSIAPITDYLFLAIVGVATNH